MAAMAHAAHARRAAAVVLVASSTVLAACGGSSSSSSSTGSTPSTSGTTTTRTVPAAQYADSVCGSVSSWINSIKSESNTLTTNLSGVSNLSTARAELVRFLQSAVLSTDRLIAQSHAAGTPDVSQGAQATAAINNAFVSIRSSFVSARNRAATLPVNDSNSFQQGASSISSSISTQAKQASSTLKSTGVGTGPLSTAFSQSAACRQVSQQTSTSS
jgi:hypothetical protein